nr:CidA/LrgA family protein [Pseudochelatococcus lubricantis]
MSFVRRGLPENRWAQAAVLVAFWLAGEGAVRLLPIPLPGSLLGLTALLVLLSTGWLRLSRVQRGAECFLSDMLLFFVPAVLAIMDHREFLSLLGVKVLVVILASTVTVMIVTALTVDLSYRWISRHEHRDAVVE